LWFFRDERGMTLVELMVAAVIFMFVAAGFGSLYLSSMRAIDRGSAQVFVQQQGTLIQEEISRQLRPAVALAAASSGNTCAGVAAPQAMAFQITPAAAARDYFAGVTTSPFRCIYQKAETIVVTDPFPQLYLCAIAAPGSGMISDALGSSGNCVANTKRNLLRSELDPARFRLGVTLAASGSAQLRVANASFTQLVVGSTTCPSDVAVAALSLCGRFDLTDGTLFTSQFQSGTPIAGLRFGFNVSMRN